MSDLYIYEDLEELDEVFGDLNMTMLHSGEKHRVFVYGTLMSEMRNHGRLDTTEVKLLSDKAVTERDDFTMLSRKTGAGYMAPIAFIDGLPEYPSIIGGEVYEISNSTLIMLDQMEGHPDVYQRQKMSIIYNGHTESIWMYVYVNSILDEYSDDGVECAKFSRNALTLNNLYTWRGL